MSRNDVSFSRALKNGQRAELKTMAEERKEKRKEIVLVVFVLWYSEWREEGVGYFTLQINTNGKSAMFFSATVGMGPKEVNHRLTCHSQFKKIKKTLSQNIQSFLRQTPHPSYPFHLLHIYAVKSHFLYTNVGECGVSKFYFFLFNWFKEFMGPTRPKIHWVITEVHNSTFHPLRSCYWGAKLVIIVGRLQYFVFEVHAILVWAIIVCV